MYQLLKNRIKAGEMLVEKLISYKNSPDTIVFALPRGGVPVAYVIATYLNLPLDVIIVRKLGFPGHEEYAMGAITSNSVFINPDVATQINLADLKIQAIIKKEQQELLRRNKLYRQDKVMPDLHDKQVILVDDGIATGSSITAAIMLLKKMQVKSIILATPILPPDTLNDLKTLVDKVIYLFAPEPFWGVGRWYEDFPQTSDEEVICLCKKANQRILGVQQ